MRIEYVGIKPSRADTVAGTGLVWTPGQVHEVGDAKAKRLLAHPDIWREVRPVAVSDNYEPGVSGVAVYADGAMEAENVSIPPNIDTMNDGQLRALAKARGIKVHHKHSAETIRSLLRA